MTEISPVMTLGRKQVASYKESGYLVVRKLISESDIDGLRALIYRLYRKFEPDDSSLQGLPAPWNDASLDARMIALRAKRPKTFGALYDCAQGSIELMRLVTDPRATAVAAAALGDTPENLSFSGIMLRMDCPNDKRNVLDWHQDRAYYPQNFDGNNGLVLTVALQDIDREDGSVLLCPKSHQEGLVEPRTTEKTDYISTEQRALPEDLVAPYEPVEATLKKGDALLINMNLIHRSGVNTGKRIRFSALCRFHRVSANDYVPFGLLYQFNDFMMRKVTGDDRD